MSSDVSQEPISQEANNTSIKQEAKSKPKNHFMQINPHINLIYVYFLHNLYRMTLMTFIKVYTRTKRNVIC